MITHKSLDLVMKALPSLDDSIMNLNWKLMKGDITFSAQFQITNFHDWDTKFLLKIFDFKVMITAS